MRFITWLDRSLGRLYVWCGYAAAVSLVALTLLIITSIVARLLGVYIAGLAEYSGYAMAATGFLGLAYTFHEGGHIRVELLLGAVGPGARRGLQIWGVVVGAFFACYLAWYLVDMTWVSWVLGDRSESAAATLLWIPQTATATGSVVMAICIVHRLARLVFGGGDGAGDPALRIGGKGEV